MKLNDNTEMMVESISEHHDGPSEVVPGTNSASSVMQASSDVRQRRVIDAALRHCRASKEQLEVLNKPSVRA